MFTGIGDGGSSPAGSRPGTAVWARLTPGRITLVYLAFGLAGLVASDVLLTAVVSDPLLSRLQAAKGAAEVVATAGLIYGLTRLHERSLGRQADDLRRHRRELQVLHRVLRHNLRNDLTVIRGTVEQLRERVDDGGQAADCESVLAAADEILHYTRRADEIRRLTSGGERVTLDLAEVVPAALTSLGASSDRVEQSLPDAAMVTVPPMFPQAVRELLENALVHGDGEVTVRVDHSGGPAGYTRLTVADDGPGLPDRVRKVLADGEHSQLVHMDGMGLWLVYLCAVESGGDFRIEQSGPEGTTITLLVPTAGGDRTLFPSLGGERSLAAAGTG